MKKFKFRFEKILELRMLKEEEKKKDLAYYISKLNLLQDEVEQLKKDKTVIQEALFSQETGLKDRAYYFDTLKNLDLFFIKKQQKMSELDPFIKNAQQGYIEARKDSKTFELLKEKDQATYLKEFKKEEQKIIDEYSMGTYVKNKKSSS